MTICVNENVSCLYQALKDQIKDGIIYDLCDVYHDFEYKATNDNVKLIPKQGFASQVKLPIDLDPNYKALKVNIINGLFTDASGYCHKIKINKEVVLNF